MTDVLTSAQADAHYAQVCSQIGAIVIERDALLDRAEDLDRQIDALKAQRLQYAAQVFVLSHNEKAVADLDPRVPPAKVASVKHDGK